MTDPLDQIPDALRAVLDDPAVQASQPDGISFELLMPRDAMRQANLDLRREVGWPQDWLIIGDMCPGPIFIDLAGDEPRVFTVDNAGGWTSANRISCWAQSPLGYVMQTVQDSDVDGERAGIDARLLRRARAWPVPDEASEKSEATRLPHQYEARVADADARYVPATRAGTWRSGAFSIIGVGCFAGALALFFFGNPPICAKGMLFVLGVVFFYFGYSADDSFYRLEGESFEDALRYRSHQSRAGRRMRD